ncbi:hypothetical protein WICMUC_001588 [Wickerhamomyces mucosus]|uniref:Importin N-terminal domain-containing protein n=1 Tax=Wickerhamomyces mucosus TaxID=1378264 RepID=A0A9P8PUC7_9ASCO|nr:hypothetical protein WICMUC_001588 [Wickerhamomyces mucosus]
MSWEPNYDAVGQLKHILQGTLSSNGQERIQATEALEQAKYQQDFKNYLLYILVLDSGESSAQIRASAGLALKNSINKDFQLASNEFLLNNVIKGLLIDEALARNITGNVITTMFSQLGVSKWPSILPQLIELAEKGDGKAQEGAASTLAKICEDSSHILDNEFQGERPLDFMVPKFIELTGSSSNKVRAKSLNSLNHIMLLKTQSFLVHLDSFLQRLFQLAVDQDEEVRKNVCMSFTTILETRPDKLVPHLSDVINYALHSIQHSEPEVALEAADFILALSTSDIPENLIQPHLHNILPVLLQNIVYDEMDIVLLEAEDEDDANQEDKDEDIRPTAAKIKSSHTAKSNTNNGQNNVVNHEGVDNDDDEDDDEEEDGDDDFVSEWNIRRCAGATLDVLTTSLPKEVLDIILPILRENIVSEQWPVREAAILAFGAVAEGGYEYASRQLPALIPFLVERLQDKEASIRQITCWTLGRYSPWICSEAIEEGGQFNNYFNHTFKAILQSCLDKKKNVQQSACSSIAHFIENADPELIQPYDKPLIQTFERCFKVYKRLNLIVLYDALQTLINKIELDDEGTAILLPILIAKWEILQDEDKELWPLLECMSSVAASLGEKFAPYAIQVHQRAVRILSNCIELEKQTIVNPTIITPEKDFIITSIDLIDGLVQGLEEHSGELIDENLISLLLETFEDTNDDVRQSSYALLGDLAINTPNKLNNKLSSIVSSIGQEIIARSNDNFPVVNNATWALGEMSLRLDLSQYLEKLIGLLIDLINSQINETALENGAITIGRIGINSPEIFANHIPEFALSWCTYMMYMEENEEKETSFQGMCNIILNNPVGLNESTLPMFVNCISMYQSPGQKLAEIFQKLLLGYKQMLGDNWGLFIGKIENSAELIHKYQL